jgi:hypothetical protein
MFDKVSADELAGLQTLARRVRSELAAAGLPTALLAAGLNSAGVCLRGVAE